MYWENSNLALSERLIPTKYIPIAFFSFKKKDLALTNWRETIFFVCAEAKRWPTNRTAPIHCTEYCLPELLQLTKIANRSIDRSIHWSSLFWMIDPNAHKIKNQAKAMPESKLNWTVSSFLFSTMANAVSTLAGSGRSRRNGKFVVVAALSYPCFIILRTVPFTHF